MDKAKPATLRYCGTVDFASGVWVGVELDSAEGKNDGVIQDTIYFKCSPNHGTCNQSRVPCDRQPLTKISVDFCLAHDPAGQKFRKIPPRSDADGFAWLGLFVPLNRVSKFPSASSVKSSSITLSSKQKCSPFFRP